MSARIKILALAVFISTLCFQQGFATPVNADDPEWREEIELLPTGTRRVDVPSATHEAHATQPQFAAVGMMTRGGSLCSATLIDAEWVLTAAHCVNPLQAASTHVFNLAGPQGAVAADAVYSHPSYTGDITDGFDIALLHLSTPITSVTPASIYRGSSELGSPITVVGYGKSGTGQTGSVTGAGTLRAGDNVVDAFYFTGNTGLLWDFDSPLDDPQHTNTNFIGSSEPLPLEYAVAPGDSGGPSFLLESGNYFVAGVTSGEADTFEYPGATEPNNRSTYGDVNVVTRVSSYVDFIDNLVVVPEPSTLSLLLMSALLLRGWRGALRRDS